MEQAGDRANADSDERRRVPGTALTGRLVEAGDDVSVYAGWNCGAGAEGSYAVDPIRRAIDHCCSAAIGCAEPNHVAGDGRGTRGAG